MVNRTKFEQLIDRLTKARPQPSAPRAGFKASGSRYGNGGKVTRKKTV